MLHCDKKGQCSNNNAVSGKWRRARSKWGRDLRLQTLEFNTLYDVIHNDMNIHACCVLCIDYYRCILFDFLILDPFGMSWCEIFTNTSTCQGPAFCEATWNIAAAKPVMERVIASVDLAPSINPSILLCFLTATAFLDVQTAWRSLTFISGSNTKIIHQPQLQRKTTKAKERRMAPSNYSRQNLSVMNLTEMHIFCWAGAAYSGNRMGKDGKNPTKQRTFGLRQRAVEPRPAHGGIWRLLSVWMHKCLLSFFVIWTSHESRKKLAKGRFFTQPRYIVATQHWLATSQRTSIGWLQAPKISFTQFRLYSCHWKTTAIIKLYVLKVLHLSASKFSSQRHCCGALVLLTKL